MTPPGHLAFAYLVARRGAPAADRARLPAFAMLGSLVPDLIDKTLLLLGAYPWGRTIGHSAVAWALIAGHVMIAEVILPSSRAVRWLFAGILTHFVADLTDDLVAGVFHTGFPLSSWFLWPSYNPDQWDWRVAALFPQPEGITFYEVAVIALATLWMLWDRRFFPMEGPDGGNRRNG